VPKSLDEFRQLKETEASQGGKKVNWEEVARVIIAKDQAFTVKEIWEHPEMVNKRVTQFRTMNALNKLFEDGVIDRKYDGKRYWYCRKEGSIRGRANRKR